MLKTLLSVFLALGVLAARGQGTKVPASGTETTFDVIVGISEKSETRMVKAVKKFFAENPPGISYLGYCNSQRCFILRASLSHFYSSDSVVNFLRNKFGAGVLGCKDYSVQEFYRNCNFKNEQEYKYFKTTYR